MLFLIIVIVPQMEPILNNNKPDCHLKLEIACSRSGFQHLICAEMEPVLNNNESNCQLNIEITCSIITCVQTLIILRWVDSLYPMSDNSNASEIDPTFSKCNNRTYLEIITVFNSIKMLIIALLRINHNSLLSVKNIV